MKKIISILCVGALAAVLLCGCGSQGSAQQPAGDGSKSGLEDGPTIEPDDLSIMMTESYKNARETFHNVTGVWMPAVEGFEAEIDVSPDEKSVCFDSHGNKQLYLDAKEALTESFGPPSVEDPESDDVELYGSTWEVPVQGGIAWFDVIYDQHDPADPWVYMNFHIEPAEG